ncbi:SDR family oxidoreductase, partial [Rhodococcus sp. NPDC058514]
MATDEVRTVLLTGASGVIGRAVLDALEGKRVYALRHRSTAASRENVTWIQGDVTDPDLGLGESYPGLAHEVDRVVHVAAAVEFDSTGHDIDRTNRLGTSHVVDFARAANAGMIHLSSAFVNRRSQARSVTGTGCADGRDAYLCSKVGGEEVVRTSGVPYAILRPSLLIGDSRTGEIARHQGLHAFLGAFAKGVLPFVPFPPETRIDFVPQDVVAGAVARLIDSELIGAEYWITAGEHAVTAREMMDAVHRALGAAGQTAVTPRFFATEAVQRLLQPAFFGSLDGKARNKFEQLLAVASLVCEDRFPSDLGTG